MEYHLYVQDHADCVLVGPDKPSYRTTLLMFSHLFLVKIFFCTYISCWGRHFSVWGCPARPSPLFKNRTFLSFWVTQPGQKQTNVFLQQQKGEEPDEVEGS